MSELKHKLGECIWWLIILAERMNIDICEALQIFLSNVALQCKMIIKVGKSNSEMENF